MERSQFCESRSPICVWAQGSWPGAFTLRRRAKSADARAASCCFCSAIASGAASAWTPRKSLRESAVTEAGRSRALACKRSNLYAKFRPSVCEWPAHRGERPSRAKR